MMKKRQTQRSIGFIQGIAYAATMIKSNGFDAFDLISESGIPIADIRCYAEKSDVEQIEDILSALETH